MVGGLTTVVVTVFLNIYSDTTSERHVTFYRPQCPQGYCALGDYAQGTSPDEKNYGVTLCFKDESARNPLLLRPLGYVQIWRSNSRLKGEGVDNEGSSGLGSETHASTEFSGSRASGENSEDLESSDKTAAIWRAVSPSDQYVAIGDVVTTGAKPSRLSTCVVHKSLVTSGARGRRIWLGDSGSVSLWSIAHSHAYLDLRNFISNNNRNAPTMGFRSLIPEILPPPPSGHLITRTLQGKDLHLIYRDNCRGTLEYLNIYAPQPPIGFTALGHYVEKGYEKSDTAHIQVVKELGNSTLLANPVKYRQVWNSKNIGDMTEIAFWRPIPPPGYLCTGDIVTIAGSEPPSINSIACLHWSLLRRSRRGSRVWWNRNSPFGQDPDKGITVWRVGSISNCESPNTFIAHPGFVTPPSERLLFHCLPDVNTEI